MPKRITRALLLLIILLLLTSCGVPAAVDPIVPEDTTAPIEITVPVATVPDLPPDSSAPVSELRNPFTNQPIETMPNRPVVVTIGNNGGARPQSGLEAADLLYEIPAEGGVSRYLAVYFTAMPEKIGPVRSARPYLLDIAKEWNGVYVHVGGSPDALSILEKGNWSYINEFGYGSYFWRDKDRSAPNNLYTSMENLLTVLDKKGWNVEKEVHGFCFFEEGASFDGESADSIKITYPPSANNSYKYNQLTGLYMRYIDNKEQLEKESGQQLAVSNVLVQYVTSKRLDDEGRLEINLLAGGQAMLFSGGKVVLGTWERANILSPTVFKTTAGEEMKLAAGKTWIQVVDQTCKVSYEDSQKKN